LQRHRPPARLCLRALQPTLRERTADVDDPCGSVDIALFERDPFGWTKPSRGGEDHHRRIARREPGRDRVELGPRLERALLPAPRRRVIHAELRRVDIDHPPDDRPREHLPQRLRGLEAVALRERDPPGSDLLRAQLADRSIDEDCNRLPEQPAQLLDRHWVNVMLLEVRLHEFGDREGSRDPLLPSQPFQLALQSLRSVAF
jgi:hypothetical protein